MEDVMIDLETYGTEAGCGIVSLGAVFFSEHGLGPGFYEVINHNSCLDANLVDDPNTIEWWSNQDPNVKKEFDKAWSNEGFQLSEVLENFTLYLTNTYNINLDNLRIWGNGANFDNPILRKAYKAIDMEPPWKFWNDKCYRTYKGLNTDIELVRQGPLHHALYDAMSQAAHAVSIMNWFEDLKRG